MSISFTKVYSKIIPDVCKITPTFFKEERGVIWTSFNYDKMRTILPENVNFNHDKFSKSKFNVLRGIHGDHKSWKLVSCIYGNIQQVVVDMRENSNSFLKNISYDLNDINKSMILIPPGMGNAFYVKSEFAIYHYKLAYEGEYVDADGQFSLAWNDPRLNIKWSTNNPILSERDKS